LFGISKYDRNKMKRIRSIGLGYPFPRSISIDLGLLLIRLATGIFLCTVFEKFLPRDGRWGPQDWFIADIAKMGFPFPSFFAWCAVLSEFFGGILLALGLLARPAAFFNAVTTFVAAFVFHKGDVSGSALLGTVFFASTLGLTLTGPGRMSIDYLMFRLWTTAPTTGDPSDARKSPVVREFES
jgi:putative oxidoreductase